MREEDPKKQWPGSFSLPHGSIFDYITGILRSPLGECEDPAQVRAPLPFHGKV
jgi:hypothetical protein